MMKLSVWQRLPLFKKNGRRREEPRIQIFKALEELEELVRYDIGVKDVLVSLKTNGGGQRVLQIYVVPSPRYKRTPKFRDLAGRIRNTVAPRIGAPHVQIQVMRMKDPALHASSRDPLCLEEGLLF
ncbi:MAG: hypothetical protein Greene101447_422 [Parcubacteria group bacterium Greene1014_47]|nr:MAG: hypothetical protein Greene101447_422 [Parcubacteria group bacterium Greene1014_47]